MNEPKIIFDNTFRINTFECDINRQWKPAAFLQHLTEDAGNHATILGCGYHEMFAQNLYWVHSRMKIKFFQFPLADDQITIRTWPKTIQQKIFFIRDYEVLDANGLLLAAATSAWLVIDVTTRRMVMPGLLNLDLPSLPDRVGLDEPLDRLSHSRTGDEQLRVKAGYSAVDILGHVNNSRYVEWVCDSFPMDMHRQHSLDWIQINYEREILPGEEVALFSSQSEDDPYQWAVEGINRTNDSRAFQSALRWKE